MILTDIGEIGVHLKDKTYILRPSFYAMSKIGTPAEIVETYGILMANPENADEVKLQFDKALITIFSCTDEDVSSIFGYTNERLKYVVKKASYAEIIEIARSLIKHGVTGVQKPLKESNGEPKGEYVSEFKYRVNVAMAMAHLGLSEREAWDMTTTGLIEALRAKFPEQKSSTNKAPSIDEHNATMDWFDKIDAQRKANKRRY